MDPNTWVFLVVVALNLAGAWLFGNIKWVLVLLAVATLAVPFLYQRIVGEDDDR